MITKPRVLVLLAAFNGATWLAEQVGTILGQVDVDVNLTISDDGSTDGTRKVLEDLSADNRVHVVYTPAPTGSAAQNFLSLIRITPANNYDFIALADQDDLWLQGRLIRSCTALSESGAQGYSSSVVAFWGNSHQNILRQVAKPTATDFLFEGAGQGCTYVLGVTFYRRLREYLIQHMSETVLLHYHDWAIYALSRVWKEKWIFDPKPGLKYRQHGGNDTGARTSIGGVRRRVGQIRNGWYSRQLYVIAKVCSCAAPEDTNLSEWLKILASPRGMRRRWLMAAFCLRGGRRRFSDRLVVLGAVAMGWI